MEHNAGGILPVLVTVGIKRAPKQGKGIGPIEEGGLVILIGLGSATAKDEALPTLVEHLRGARKQAVCMRIVVKADADKGRAKLLWIARHVPEYVSGLIVEGGEKIPRARRGGLAPAH